MVWAKLDDEILDNPKIARAGVFGFALHVAAITWCSRNLTDGFIPTSRVTALLTLDRVHFDVANPFALIDGPRSMGGEEGLDALAIADHLVLVGLWHSVDGGYELHDFLKYNPSREETLAKRQKDSQRQERSRSRRKSPAESHAKSRRDSRVTSGVNPQPPEPDPEPLRDPPSRARAREGQVQRDLPVTDDVRDVWESLTLTRQPGLPLEDAWLGFCGHYADQDFGSRIAVLGKWQKWIANQCRYAERDRQREQAAPSQRAGPRSQRQPHDPEWLERMRKTGTGGGEL
jgi:hypothetical protein